jgi:hypothetical protein
LNSITPQDDCPDEVEVDVSIESNEYHSDQKSVGTARFKEVNGTMGVKILLAPTR